MRKIRRPTVNQLTLLDGFDKQIKRDERLVDSLITALNNFKFFRVNARFSSLSKKKEIEEALGQILYWTAFLAHKKSRHIEKFKSSWSLDYFLDMTKEKEYHLHIDEPQDPDTLAEWFQNGHMRIKTLFMGYKDLLQDDRNITKRILDNFDNIHTLAHAV